MSSDNSPPNSDSVLPMLQQPYHHDLDVMTVDRLTPKGEEPDVELVEFDYGGDIKSNCASQSGNDDLEDDLYWGPKLQPMADHNDCDHSNPNPNCDNTNCNITYSSTHSD
ncbi:hypothetical protein PILCRDRAFT_90985 [Piloderma croceum F 1598]|uniref:Uncharacterized protein n=1 Tax=Piloderma croceum (strain F 1598) TaxID=765440 RepID=A0A0C3EYS7_PILCF|nr:hypothetical protein PILCRDRAFT_90985 [Piloderma croceum F 1598]